MQHLVARQKTSISHQNRLSILCDTRLSQRKLVHKKHLRASTILNIVSKLREAGIIETGDALSGARVGSPKHALRILARLVVRRRTRRKVLPHPLTDISQASNEEFLDYCARHLASLINLIDVAHLIVASDTQLIAHADFETRK